MRKIILSLVLLFLFLFIGVNNSFSNYQFEKQILMDDWEADREGYMAFIPLYEHYDEKGNAELNKKGNYDDYKNELLKFNLTKKDCKYISVFYKSEDGKNVYFSCGKKLKDSHLYPDWTIYINGEKIGEDNKNYNFNGPVVTSIVVNGDKVTIDIVVSYFVGAGVRLIYKDIGYIQKKNILKIKNKLKNTKWNKYVLKFDKIIPKLSLEKLKKIKGKLERIDLNDKKYFKYKNILNYLKLKIEYIIITEYTVEDTHEEIYNKYPENAVERTNEYSDVIDTPLVVEAGKLGINKNELKKCIIENKFLNKINSQMKVGADTFGISGTPGNVLINNETGEYIVVSGAYPKETFIEKFEGLLEEKTKEIGKSSKIFKKNTDKNTLMFITDKRDKNSQTDEIIKGLKEISSLKDIKVLNYDFYDKGVKEYLETNNIKNLPAIIFTNNNVDEQVNRYLIKLNDNSYSLNIGAQYSPFKKIISKEKLDQIKKGSYIDGKENAKLTWLEYSDLECPFCQKLHNSDVKITLKEKYGDDLNIVFNHFPLGFHRKAIPGANILECVGELGGSEKFYKIIDYAYKNKIQE